MAHHVLYSALQGHLCYDGYLWAPFDTLLNVPRLQLFDENKFGTIRPLDVTFPIGRSIPRQVETQATTRPR